MKMANMDDYFDVVIVGTGAAGLYCALNLPARYRILLLTKQKADESDSFLAQGGICMQHGEADYRPFFDDTMRAGHYENNPATVDLMIRSSNSIIRDLVRRGVRFARDDHGALRFTREGAHSRPRILFHEDITGHEITQTLLNEVREHRTARAYDSAGFLRRCLGLRRCHCCRPGRRTASHRGRGGGAGLRRHRRVV